MNFNKEFFYILGLIFLFFTKNQISFPVKSKYSIIINNISQIFFILFYFIENYLSKTKKSFISNQDLLYLKGSSNDQINPALRMKIYLLTIIILSFFEIYLTIDFELEEVSQFFLFTFCILIQKYCYNSEFHSHHYPSITINFLSVIFITIQIYMYLKSNILNTLKYIFRNFCFIFTIFLIKHINTYYFINGYLLISLIGVIQFITGLIYFWEELKEDITYLINFVHPISCFLICIVHNFIYFKIVFTLDLIYAILSKGVSDIFVLIINLFVPNENEVKKYDNIIDYTIICISIISVLTNFIYLEIIEIKYCGLNKYTKKNIAKRGEYDQEKILMSFNEKSEMSVRSSIL